MAPASHTIFLAQLSGACGFWVLAWWLFFQAVDAKLPHNERAPALFGSLVLFAIPIVLFL